MIKVYRHDGSFYEVEDTVVVLPQHEPEPEAEPTTEEILNAMLGVN